jgi:glycosyltransferase involved in cell wall biosynthesis
MTRFHYVSPSLLPSRSANSVHVVLQCDGLARAGAAITLYAKRTIADRHQLDGVLRESYGVDTSSWQLRSFHSGITRAETLRIALMAVAEVLRAPSEEIVLSRNLHAAWLLAAARRPMLFETHQLEYGVRKAMQRWVMTRPWVRTVAISDCLVDCLEDHHGTRLPRPLVLHDAARDGIERLAPWSRRSRLIELLDPAVDNISSSTAVCGYFGQLYAGRGIEIIEAMAIARPDCTFLVFGGSDGDVFARRTVASPNLHFRGHVPHPLAQRLQAAVDVLLMPYQQSVSIGIAHHDTARWMSPMKMFEYLAAGVPVISSDLPVLREVLGQGVNALLVAPDQAEEWISALDRLVNDPALAATLGERAHQQYRQRHTWTRRAEALLAGAREL